MKKMIFLIFILSIMIFTACGTDGHYVEQNGLESVSQESSLKGQYGSTAASSDIMEDKSGIESEAGEDIVSMDNAAGYTSLSTDETMRIYDIEDGYLEVPFYPQLPQNQYDWSLLGKDGKYLSYDDPDYDVTIGTDVSKFQGDVDWEKVKADGVDFVMIRAAYRGYKTGSLETDECFEKNIEGALGAGLDAGVYFLSQALNDKEADEEADYLYSLIKKYDITYPVVVDSEKIKTGTARTVSMSNAEMTDTVLEFCSRIKKYGYSPAIYANSEWLTTRLDIRRLTGVDIWYADYQITDNDEVPLYRYPFYMWQYTNSAQVDGISGDADLNICFRKKYERQGAQ